MEDIDAKQLSLFYGRRVKELRKELKITQQQLADMTGIKREYISLIEQGRTDMQLSTLIRIANALGLRLSLDLQFA